MRENGKAPVTGRPGENEGDQIMPQSLVENTGPVWHVFLSHAQIEVLSSPGAQLGVGLLPPPYDVAIEAAISYIALIDSLGGDQGVDITGVVGVQGVLVTPHTLGAYGWLVKGVGVAIAAGETIANFVIKVAGSVKAIAEEVCNAPAIITAILTGNPVIGAVVGLASGIFGHNNPPDTTPGAVKANVKVANLNQLTAHETFVLMGVGSGNDQAALLSWQGFFSAQQGGGAQVYANRSVASIWETWTLIDNGDGTVSFRAYDGKHYLGTSSIPDHSCWADQTQNQPHGWCRFKMEYLDGCHVALQTVYGTYVTVWKNASDAG
jgi:hypothetical protein